MLKSKTVKIFEAREVFEAVRKRFGEDVESDFCVMHNPPIESAIYFWIPNDNEAWDACEICDKYVADVLMRKGGLTWGDSCLLYFDYYYYYC